MSGIVWNHGSGGSSGGTELAGRQLERRMPADLLEEFQIYPAHYDQGAADPGKIQVLWCHHCHEAAGLSYLGARGWQRFAKIVFVSDWQARRIVSLYDIPWSRCQVIRNAIELAPASTVTFGPLPARVPIRLMHTCVPDRGLPILAAAFTEICKRRDDVELDVFSSFGLYGEAWADLDKHFDQVFDVLRQNPRVRIHGPTPNDQVLAALARAHVFAYPSTVLETSCMSLMEAMSAGLACVHPDYGALSETAAGWTRMYKHEADWTLHARRFYFELMAVVDALRDGDQPLLSRLAAQKTFADENYGWNRRARHWESFLRELAGARPG